MKPRTLAGRLLCALLLTLCLVTQAGCPSLQPGPIDPGADPVVVNAERIARVGLATVNAFVAWEDANHDFVREHLPAVRKLADQLRDDFPKAYAQLRTATEAYKATRAAADELTLAAKLKVVDDFVRDAANAHRNAKQAKDPAHEPPRP
jgi:hypothetical protein